MLIKTKSAPSDLNLIQLSVFHFKERKAYYIGCYPAKQDAQGFVTTGITSGTSIKFEDTKRKSEKRIAEIEEALASLFKDKKGSIYELVQRIATKNNMVLEDE